DPQGAEGYYRLFERSWKRFLAIWPLMSKLGPLELDSEEFAHWDIEAAGPNWGGCDPHRVFPPKTTHPPPTAQPQPAADAPARAPGRSTTSSAARSCACCAPRGRSAWC